MKIIRQAFVLISSLTLISCGGDGSSSKKSDDPGPTPIPGPLPTGFDGVWLIESEGVSPQFVFKGQKLALISQNESQLTIETCDTYDNELVNTYSITGNVVLHRGDEETFTMTFSDNDTATGRLFPNDGLWTEEFTARKISSSTSFPDTDSILQIHSLNKGFDSIISDESHPIQCFSIGILETHETAETQFTVNYIDISAGDISISTYQTLSTDSSDSWTEISVTAGNEEFMFENVEGDINISFDSTTVDVLLNDDYINDNADLSFTLNN